MKRAVAILLAIIAGLVALYCGNFPAVRFVAAYLTPIRFYGKVIDQYGAPVPDAEVTVSANSTPFGNGTKRTLRTDAAGLFEVWGMHGISLGVSVSKAGYYHVLPSEGKPGSERGDDYFDTGNGKVAHPDKAKPVILFLYKAGDTEPLEVLHSPSMNLPNGTPVTLDMSFNDLGKRHPCVFRITAWADAEHKDKMGNYDWRVEIRPVDGEIQPRAGHFDFIAPETGYHEVETIVMSADLPHTWSDVIKRDFFVHFRDGTYARIELSIGSPPHGSVEVSGFLNYKPGSRNLEAYTGNILYHR